MSSRQHPFFLGRFSRPCFVMPNMIYLHQYQMYGYYHACIAILAHWTQFAFMDSIVLFS
jgi:hypothetical protein